MTSRSGPKKSIVDYALGLCWGAWSELGVSGWARTHQDWGVDPEPLVVFTAALGDRDPRLRDEAMDWCIHNNRYISRVRLRNILRQWPGSIEDLWGEFAGTVNARAGIHWPGGTSERAEYRITGRSRLRSLEEPSLVCLRMKAIFGVAARTEILRRLLFGDGHVVSVVVLATATAYMKRIVAEECETLERAGVLSVRIVRNRFYYSLARRTELKVFVGRLPSICPDWTTLLRMVQTLVRLEGAATTLPQRALVVEARRALREIEDDLDTLGIAGPPETQGPALVEEMRQWSEKTLHCLAAGDWPA